MDPLGNMETPDIWIPGGCKVDTISELGGHGKEYEKGKSEGCKVYKKCMPRNTEEKTHLFLFT